MPTTGDPDEWDENMQVNLLGPMRLTRRLTPAMAEKKEGYHINISSSAGKHPSPSQCAYSAAKWGMTGFSLSSAKVYCALTWLCYSAVHNKLCCSALLLSCAYSALLLSSAAQFRYSALLSSSALLYELCCSAVCDACNPCDAQD